MHCKLELQTSLPNKDILLTTCRQPSSFAKSSSFGGGRDVSVRENLDLRMAYQFSRKGCFKCGNLGHIAESCSSDQRLCYNCRDCLATVDTAIPTGPASMKSKTCYKCQQEGHIARECPENADFMG
ncbi:hypothetical protein B0H14DRAFT_607687 [Mycena olivaceomarginata]|nr:hypothetical protein B0H14DRAFT_607687 [Mycena olivaceomarginata]